MNTSFRHLNLDWNAEPNAPDSRVKAHEDTVVLSFLMNSFVFKKYSEDDVGTLIFKKCRMYRLGSTNDEGWYRGQCRFSAIAPKWGEFYEIVGDALLDESPRDWVMLGNPTGAQHHFLFYLRDNTFECVADDWILAIHPHAARAWGHAA